MIDRDLLYHPAIQFEVGPHKAMHTCFAGQVIEALPLEGFQAAACITKPVMGNEIPDFVG